MTELWHLKKKKKGATITFRGQWVTAATFLIKSGSDSFLNSLFLDGFVILSLINV